MASYDVPVKHTARGAGFVLDAYDAANAVPRTITDSRSGEDHATHYLPHTWAHAGPYGHMQVRHVPMFHLVELGETMFLRFLARRFGPRGSRERSKPPGPACHVSLGMGCPGTGDRAVL